jgi:hypothetical protein
LKNNQVVEVKCVTNLGLSENKSFCEEENIKNPDMSKQRKKKHTKYSEDATEFQLSANGLQKSIPGMDKRLLPAEMRCVTLTPGFTHHKKYYAFRSTVIYSYNAIAWKRRTHQDR